MAQDELRCLDSKNQQKTSSLPEQECSEGVSRRSVLAAGIGLAASACAKSPKESAEIAATSSTASEGTTLPPGIRALREGRQVLGRVEELPMIAGQELAGTAPPYFPQPGEMSMNAVGAEKDFVLDVAYLNIPIPKVDGVVLMGKVRAFNGHVPGPTIRCDPGDRLNIKLRNQLPADETFTYDYQGCVTDEGQNAMEAGLPHGFNDTNLHTHGLHVSPASLCGDQECGPPPYSQRPTLASDDVFITVPPGETQEYCIVLPDFHAPGTHWYHAHKHGSTAIQVNNGLAGALIVQEQGDFRILGDEPHEDLIFLMQEIMEVDGGNDQLVYAKETGDSSKFLINGSFQPRLQMRAGEIQRWRFINGTSRPRGLTKLRLVKLTDESLRDSSDLFFKEQRGQNLEENSGFSMAALETQNPELFERLSTFERVTKENAQPMNLIAVDGISFYGKPPKEVTEWNFAPGNRADFLVRIDEPGSYAIVKALHEYPPGQNPENQCLAIVEVGDGTREMEMPSIIPGVAPCYLEPIRSVETEKNVNFQAQSSRSWHTVCPEPTPWTCAGEEIKCNGERRPCDPVDQAALLPRIFAIDCKRFELMSEPKYTMTLNSVEEWTLRNFSGGAHPFHIHVSPFQVVEIFDPATGVKQRFDPDEALWQDTVAIPLPANGQQGYVKIRQRFLTFPGTFVIHCHFLNHEDMGMMKRVDIVPSPEAPGHGPCVPVKICSLG